MKNNALVYANQTKLFVHAMTFGEWFRGQIQKNRPGISNAEIARQTGYSPTYIGNLLRDYNPNTKDGKGRPSEEVVEKIAKFIGGDINEARLAAGYAAESTQTKPKSFPELIKVLESVGIVDLQMFGGNEVFEDFTEADYEDFVERINSDLQLEVKKKNREKPKT